ncbi:esterase [Cellulomonas sp. WB94]|uniref:alpha/beta hydrolase n=1 Tax=Cellulomonas sp. WB94 TaxID=2173174 RepID=UPI000D5723DC|nr:alpha/beta hydrolase-fold protein [Cellulomonas sp. WB94]PVU82527.1 esterase [Cellulomonas sp. WB94]
MDSPQPVPAPTLPRDVLVALSDNHDLLSTWWPAVVAAGVAVALVVLAVARRRRGRRAWPARTGAGVALVVAAALGLNAWVGYVPSVAAAALLLTSHESVGTAATGGVVPVTIAAPAALRMPTSTTWVYTPPGYDPSASTRYPVVYLVHGTPGTSADWMSGGDIAHVMDVLIAHHLVRPMIVVAPDVNGVGQSDTECLDSTRGGSQVETYLNQVVVPWVDAHYTTAADWSHRAIGGMSSGGFCALDQGLRHPELYGAIIALEAYDNPGSGGRAMLATDAEIAAHSPRRYLPTMTFAHPVTVFLAAGGAARGGDASEAAGLAAQLTARGQSVLYRIEPGQFHTWTMARTAIPYGLRAISAALAP